MVTSLLSYPLRGKMKDANLFTNYKAVINSKNVILLTKAGSELLGLKTGSGDTDEMGIFIESPAELFGLNPVDFVEYRTAADRTGKHDEPSKEGDIDLALYGLRKYVRLALGGNPNILNLLFAPKTACIIQTFAGTSLQELAPKLLSKQVGTAFLGYMKAQKLRLLGAQGQKRVNRPDLVEKYGYDTKYAMHLIRLGLQGVELFKTGKLTLPLSDDYIETLMNIRLGRKELRWCTEYAESLEYELESKMKGTSSKLSDKPNYAAVEEWMLNTYQNAWKGLQK